MTLFVEVARVSQAIAKTRSRLEKIRLLAEFLSGLAPEEVASSAAWLTATPLSGPLGIGYAGLSVLGMLAPAAVATASIVDVEGALLSSSAHSKEAINESATALFGKLTTEERDFLVASLTGTLRQGGLSGILLQAIAKASGVAEEDVRRTAMLLGSAARAADAALGRGKGTALRSSISLFEPIAPMLASPADSVESAMAGLGVARIEWKVDGVRAQIHKEGDRVAVYSRQGNDITRGAGVLPAALFSARSCVLDAEIVLLDANGRARPFQETFSVIASGRAPPSGQRMALFTFDCLMRDGEDLFEKPLSARLVALAAVAREETRMPAIETASIEDASRFFADARARGHEGVMVKDLAAPYRLGARGEAWRKVKEVTTVDLVVLAVEWGSGRRKGLLSNLHLGARNDDGTFAMVGKTFKGLTDAMLAFQTKRLSELEIRREGHVVHVRPELVVEIAFNDVQKSPRYPGGIALRFARVLRYREDKRADETDLLTTLQALLPRPTSEETSGHQKQSKHKVKQSKHKDQLSLFGEDDAPNGRQR